MKERLNSPAKPGPGKPWRFPSNRGRMPCPAAESLIGHVDVDSARLIGPCEAMLNQDLIAMLEMGCAERGNLEDVTEEDFECLVTMSEDEMRGLLRVLVCNFAEWFNGICNDKRLSEREADLKILGMIDVLLYMVARGNLRFFGDFRVGTYKPRGPRPSRDVQERILRRIRSERRLQKEVLLSCTRDAVEHSRRGTSGPS